MLMNTQWALLAALDARLYEAEVKSARSILQRTRVTFEESQRAYDRAKELYDRTVLSTTDFQQAELDHAIATANYHNSQALLSKARINLEYTQLKAPFDGVILKRMISSGETVSSQYQVQPMLEMAASGQMIARGWLPQNALRNLTVGQSIELNLRNKRLPATIKSAGIQYRESQKDTEYLVEFSFQPPVDHKLLPGMRVQAILP